MSALSQTDNPICGRNGAVSAFRILSCLLLIAVVSLAPMGALADSELRRTWQGAHIALPPTQGKAFPVFGRWGDYRIRETINQIPWNQKLPAVVYMHGCSGISTEEESAKLFLAEQGFVVVLPDTFARRGRRSNCSTETLARSLAPESHDLRLEELNYAIDQLRALSWVDPQRIYVVGYSEGGLAAARYARNDIAGLAILSWHCDGNPPYRGLAVPPEIPLLAVLGTDDPWYRGAARSHCGQYFEGRPRALSLRLEGNGHAIMTGQDIINGELARAAILNLLNDRQR